VNPQKPEIVKNLSFYDSFHLGLNVEQALFGTSNTQVAVDTDILYGSLIRLKFKATYNVSQGKEYLCVSKASILLVEPREIHRDEGDEG
jgi:hypothetical protein